MGNPAEAAHGTRDSRGIGYLAIHLHAHLPYVVNHGTWPHGLEWLHEAAAETYLPLLGVLDRLLADGIVPRWSIDFSPVLLEQLRHPVFLREFPQYLERKIRFAQEDEAFFAQARLDHFAALARMWQGEYSQRLALFQQLDGNIVAAFGRMADRGAIELLTCAATHGYLPLLGTDESVRAQVRLAVAMHRLHFGQAPEGVWLPECGYRPAGYWQAPALPDGKTYPAFHRIGVEQALAESDLRYFFVDAHLIHGSNRFASPYGNLGIASGQAHAVYDEADAQLYQAYAVCESGTASVPKQPRSTAFPRDPRTGYQVWSGDSGYPADAHYLDFHKKRWPGGHRYWRVTGSDVQLDAKEPYDAELAQARLQQHASHFVALVSDALRNAGSREAILSAPFDAELFGHWWYEGAAFLEALARRLAAVRSGPVPVSGGEYLRRVPGQQPIQLPEGSWGAGGDSRVWLNDQTSWTYARIYNAEHELSELCTHGEWRDGALGERIARQSCRELLLMEASDWQFLITTGAARDYAERRFREHAEAFDRLLHCWHVFRAERELPQELHAELGGLEQQDSLFADVNPEFWVRGAKAEGMSLIGSASQS